MKYSSIPFTLALAACGTSSSPSDQPASQECKGDRIWDEQQQECVKPVSDATLEDVIVQDAGYVQKYEGKLYGVLEQGNNIRKPTFIQYDFTTGKLEELKDFSGNIIDLPFENGSLNNPTLSYDGNNILFSHRDTVDKVYHLNLQTGNLQYLFDAWVPDFAWSIEDPTHYFVSTIEMVSDEGEPRKKTRIYEKSVDGTFSDWLTEQGCADPEENCEIIMGIASRPKYSTGTNRDELTFTCREKDGFNYELCRTSPSSYHNSLLYTSEGLHSDLNFKIPKVFFSNDNSHQIVHLFCNTADDNVHLCKMDLDSKTIDIELQSPSFPKAFHSAIFNPSYELFLANNQLFDIKTGTELESRFPDNLALNGEEIIGRNYEWQWFAWREN